MPKIFKPAGKDKFVVFYTDQNGQRRTNADKRNAAMRLLDDPEWSQWSDHRIAEQCAVSVAFIGRLRVEATVNGLQSTNGHLRIGKDGRTYNAVNIGKIESPKLATVNGIYAPDPPDVAKARGECP
jgi:hypothetical protein